MKDSFLTPEEIKELVSRLDSQEDEWQETTAVSESSSLWQNPAETETVKAVSFIPLNEGAAKPAAHSLENFASVSFELQLVLGEAVLTIGDLLKLQEGSVITLDRLAGENAFLLLNGKLLAEGEVVVINDCFALRINSLGDDGLKETSAGGG